MKVRHGQREREPRKKSSKPIKWDVFNASVRKPCEKVGDGPIGFSCRGLLPGGRAGGRRGFEICGDDALGCGHSFALGFVSKVDHGVLKSLVRLSGIRETLIWKEFKGSVCQDR